MATVLCSEFELQSHYDAHFQSYTLEEGMNPLIFPSTGSIVSMLLFYKNSFGIK